MCLICFSNNYWIEKNKYWACFIKLTALTTKRKFLIHVFSFNEGLYWLRVFEGWEERSLSRIALDKLGLLMPCSVFTDVCYKTSTHYFIRFACQKYMLSKWMVCCTSIDEKHVCCTTRGSIRPSIVANRRARVLHLCSGNVAELIWRRCTSHRSLRKEQPLHSILIANHYIHRLAMFE